MKNKITKYVVAIQILMSSCFAFESMAFNDLEAGAYLWKLINEARLRPVKTIEAYGIDYESAKRALGDDSWILELENGLPPLAWNATLVETSSEHNIDMINRQYYSYNSPEGLSFNDRIVNSGYNPLLTGESLSILSFYLYVDPIKAVEGIFENMLRDELNPDLGYPKNIFSKNFTEIGISFVSTLLSIESDSPQKQSTINAYLVTADFGKPIETRVYIMGNIYNIGENQPTELNPLIPNQEFDNKNNYAAQLLSYKSWSPQKANDNFILLINNFIEGSRVEVSHGNLGAYQIQIPTNTFYSIELYRKIPDNNIPHGWVQGELLKRIINIGLNVNKMVDFGIN
ncbi:MAG: hypothetical protein HQK69_07275 [Desulfamplus sp.]|nr:hypothetical protein [Desulfamplus sp.]